MPARIESEVQLLRSKFGEVEIAPDLTWLKIPKFPLPLGWNAETTELLMLIPSGYPFTPPDNFYTDNGLRLENGDMPGATTPNSPQAGSNWLRFSYHVENGHWKAHENVLEGHNILTFMLGIQKRLNEAS